MCILFHITLLPPVRRLTYIIVIDGRSWRGVKLRQDVGDHGPFSAEEEVLVVVGGGMDCTASPTHALGVPLPGGRRLAHDFGAAQGLAFLHRHKQGCGTQVGGRQPRRRSVHHHNCVGIVCVLVGRAFVSDGYSSGGRLGRGVAARRSQPVDERELACRTTRCLTQCPHHHHAMHIYKDTFKRAIHCHSCRCPCFRIAPSTRQQERQRTPEGGADDDDGGMRGRGLWLAKPVRPHTAPVLQGLRHVGHPDRNTSRSSSSIKCKCFTPSRTNGGGRASPRRGDNRKRGGSAQCCKTQETKHKRYPT